jgi:preprotein translocase subunit SecE
VARNRKRAKERRTRRPSQAGNSQQGLPTATHEPVSAREPEENGVPDPLEHATPDVELADVQLAFGRPEEPEPGDEADDEEFELEVEESVEEVEEALGRDGARRRGGGFDGGVGDGGAGGGGAGELVARAPSAPERVGAIARLIGFLQGSWRELQRVQWPDRRQVMQATGVVIGFVILAAAFLGVADLLAGKLVTFILQ